MQLLIQCIHIFETQRLSANWEKSDICANNFPSSDLETFISPCVIVSLMKPAGNISFLPINQNPSVTPPLQLPISKSEVPPSPLSPRPPPKQIIPSQHPAPPSTICPSQTRPTGRKRESCPRKCNRIFCSHAPLTPPSADWPGHPSGLGSALTDKGKAEERSH